MAIIPCRECAHQISDLAASCPNCGAPAYAGKTRRRGKRIVSKLLITLMALWTLGTLFWLFAPRGASDPLTARTQSSLQRFNQSIDHLWAAAPIRTGRAPQPSTTDQRAASPRAAPYQPSSAVRSVYRTTAEQLHKDYESNVVATQTKIGDSRVQLSGNVAEIDQDATGRPVVKLWTGKDSTAAMTLAEGQRETAAQLTRGAGVEIGCDRLERSGALFQGTDCTLTIVDSPPREVNLAVFLANDNGTSRVFVVGPMTEAICQERSAEISSRLRANQRVEHVVSRNCTDAGRERIPPEGCHLNASAVSVAEIPTARLWRYDCSSSGMMARADRRRKAPAGAAARATTILAAVPSVATESNAQSGADDEGSAQTVPAPIMDSVAVSPPTPTRPATAINSAAPAAMAPATERAAANNIRFASAGNSDTGTAATPDDLAHVRGADPRAADHIASYCAQAAASINQEGFIADCRHREAEAWAGLVLLENKFPALNEASLKKCSEPPFPDTYVAKETCARYILHVQ
jgi:hypothetical protein